MNRGEENHAKLKSNRLRLIKVNHMKKVIFSVAAVIFGLSSAMAFAQSTTTANEPIPVVKKAEVNKHHTTQTHKKMHKKIEKKEIKPVVNSAS